MSECFVINCRNQCSGAGRSRGFLAEAGADLKFELEPEPIMWVGFGSFFWQVTGLKKELFQREVIQQVEHNTTGDKADHARPPVQEGVQEA